MPNFDPNDPLPKFDTFLPKVNTASFVPSFGTGSGGMNAIPKIHMPDLSFGGSSFSSGFKSFSGFLGSGSNRFSSSMGFQPTGSFTASGSGGWSFPTSWAPITTPGTGTTGSTGGGGGVGTSTGGAAALNQYNDAFAKAGALYGFDPNWLKAIATEEEGWTGTSGAGAQGIMQIMGGQYPEGERLYPNWATDPVQNIMFGAYILKQKVNENGGSLEMGTQRYLGVGVDPYTGISTEQYLASIQGFYKQLQATAQSGGVPANQTPGKSSGVINIARSFVGKIPYVWGGIPGKGATPTGWDCSGFMYWLDQNYGDGTLTMGSHYQFQQMKDSGRLFTDWGQLKPGDLIFFDTGDRSGGGAELNGASHVAMYIGNNQIVQAGNPETGTNVSTLSDYYTSKFIGAAHMSWSG